MNVQTKLTELNIGLSLMQFGPKLHQRQRYVEVNKVYEFMIDHRSYTHNQA